MTINIGTGPNDIPLNCMLGEMAYGENLLEHGYWEPQMTNLGNHTRSSNSNGWWQRIGRMVMVTYNYQWSSRTTSNGGYGVKINNLPWKVDMDFSVRQNGTVWVSGMEGVLPNLSNHPNRGNMGGYCDDTDLHFRASSVGSNVGGEVSLDGGQSTSSTTGYIYGGAMYVTDGRRNID